MPTQVQLLGLIGSLSGPVKFGHAFLWRPFSRSNKNAGFFEILNISAVVSTLQKHELAMSLMEIFLARQNNGQLHDESFWVGSSHVVHTDFAVGYEIYLYLNMGVLFIMRMVIMEEDGRIIEVANGFT